MGFTPELRNKMRWRSDVCERDNLPNSFSVCPGCTLQNMHASCGTCIIGARPGDNSEVLYIGSICIQSQNVKYESELGHRMTIKATPWPITLRRGADNDRIIDAVRIGGGRGNQTKGLGRL